MGKRIGLLVVMVVMIAGAALAQNVQGNWQGEFTTPEWQTRTLSAQIVGESWADYRAYISVGMEGQDETRGMLKGRTEKDITAFQGELDLGEALGGVYTFEGKIIKGEFNGSFKSGEKIAVFTMKRVYLKSPTLGQKPPEGAVVLMLDQGETKEQQQALYPKQQQLLDEEWNVEKRWGVGGDLSIGMQSSSIWTKKEFGDALYHIEFKTPYMPTERDQGRGNSGVYVSGRYEIQVLDSFTDEPRDNQCGGIYQQAVPLTNPCLPPGEWQTYDITYRAPRFDRDGNKTENARLTVQLNGVTIHDNLELRHPTPGGIGNKEVSQGNLLFQDHGNDVRWKNIWIKPM